MAVKNFLYKIGTRGARRAEKDLKGVDKATKAMVASGAKLALGFISIAAAVKGLQVAFSAAKLAATAENVERAFNKLGGSEGLLVQMKEALKGTIPEIELMRNAIIGIDLGATNEEIRIFAEFARLEGVRKGVDVLTVFGNILGGVLRGSTELLDNFGISLTRLNREMETLAIKAGTTASKLSVLERRELSVAAATNIMSERLSKAGDIAVTDADRYAQATSKLADFRVEFGKLFNPTTVWLINNFVDAYGRFFSLGLGEEETAAKNVVRLEAAIESIQKGTLEWLKIVKDLNIELDINAPLAEKLAILYDAEAAALTKLLDIQTAERLQILTEWANVQEKTAEATERVAKALEEVEAPFKKFDDTVQVLEPRMQLLFDSINGIAQSFITATLNAQKFGDAMVSALKAIAAEILAEIAIYVIANLLGIPVGAISGNLGSGGGFINAFRSVSGGGGPEPSIQPTTQQGPTIIFQNATIVGTDEAAVRDQLIPLINQAMANA